ncbi:MAG TPA: NUDIX hydrolase [Actinomycetota bacterium]
MKEGELVRAAGGLLLRPGPDGALEVALVHRPKYDDWSFPKGKLTAEESFEEAALREVEEETGFRARLDREIPSTRYRDANGRAKLVRYWTMTPLDGEFRPNIEVDDLRWFPLDEAARTLTYAHDRDLLRLGLRPD